MWKKMTAVVLVMLMVLALGAPMALAAINTTVTTTRSGDVLNLRKGPHKGNTPVVGYVRNGTKIALLTTDDEDDGEAWNKVRVVATGAVGYLKNKYIRYFGLDNSDGEIDDEEDDDWDFSDAGDNDGSQGTGSSGGAVGSSYARISCKTGGTVNVRSGAGTSYRVVGSGTNGERLSILSQHGSWYKVKFDNRSLSGYVHGDYVREGLSATISANGVNFRSGAGTGYRSLRKLDRGDEVILLSKSGNWSRIKVGSTYGWVYSQYVSY